jgi:hypothetical protein
VKLALVEAAEEAEAHWEEVPGSDIGSHVEVEVSAGIVEMQQIHVGPYLDKVGRQHQDAHG